MNVSDEIIKVLDAVCEKLGVAVEWTGETVLPQLQELGAKCVNYELSTSIAWLVIVALGWVLGVVLIVLAFTVFDCDDAGLVFFLVGAGLLVLCTIGCIGEIHDIICCSTFPEKVIYDFVTNMLD